VGKLRKFRGLEIREFNGGMRGEGRRARKEISNPSTLLRTGI
jgi:hypothetical protein